MEHVLLAFIYWQDAPSSESSCKGCLAFRLGSERNDRIGAPVGHASESTPHFSFVISSRLSPLLSPSLSTRPPAQDNCEQITFCPTLTASRFPFFILIVFLFPCTLGNDDRPLAAAARHQYAPEHSSIDFYPSSIFLYVRHDDDAFTYSPPTPILYRRIRLQTVGSHMYFSKPARRGRH